MKAKKWKYASFFNRLKRQVADEWMPQEVLKRYDPSGKILGAKERVTVLRVHLRPDGTLDRAEVLRSSGLDFLDGEAMSAIKRAQPFLNPPPLDADGFISFNFEFRFMADGRTDDKNIQQQRLGEP